MTADTALIGFHMHEAAAVLGWFVSEATISRPLNPKSLHGSNLPTQLHVTCMIDPEILRIPNPPSALGRQTIPIVTRFVWLLMNLKATTNS